MMNLVMIKIKIKKKRSLKLEKKHVLTNEMRSDDPQDVLKFCFNQSAKDHLVFHLSGVRRWRKAGGGATERHEK